MQGDPGVLAAAASFHTGCLHSPFASTNHSAGSKVMSSRPAGRLHSRWCEIKSYPQFCESYPQLFYISSCN